MFKNKNHKLKNFLRLLINKIKRIFKCLINSKNIKIIFLYIIGSIIYLISLKHLSGIDMRCFSYVGERCYYAIGIIISISSFIITLAIYIILFNNYNKLHLIVISIIFFFLYLIDHNAEIVKHGLFNFVVFIIITLFLFIFFCYIHFLFYLYKKGNYFQLILLNVFLLSIYVSFKVYKLNHFSCDNWTKGLNNTVIDNTSKDYPCKIIIPQPHSCYISEMGRIFNLVDKFTPTCQDFNLIKFEKEKFLKDIQNIKYYNISKKHEFGYPLTNNEIYNPNKFGSIIDRGNKSFESFINEKVILLDLYNKNKKIYYNNTPRPEVEIHLNKDGGKIYFNIIKNKTLIKQREKNTNKTHILYKNVLVMFIDTLSRAHFFRKFPKTIDFLNQFSKYEPNYAKKNMTIFQFFKYHTLDTYTDPNIKAALYGAKIHGEGTHFVNYFKNNGYIVGRVNAFCEKENIFNKNNYSLYNHGIWDHEGLSLGCITTFYDRFLITRLSAVVRKCLFGEDLNQHALKYLEKFWYTYLEQNKMFLFETLEGHEPTGQLIGYFDDILLNFLNKFYSKGYFNDTAIIIFSDHGQHLSGPFYLLDSQDFYSERSLPFLFLIVPNNEKLYKNNLYEKIRLNQQVLITPFDIYNTLIHLAFGEINEKYKLYSVPYGGSLLTELNYRTRFCQSTLFEFQVNLGTCRCIKN